MKLAASALLLYGLYCLVLFLLQRTLMFPRYLLDDGTGAGRDRGPWKWSDSAMPRPFCRQPRPPHRLGMRPQ